jgi:hypothetical protein
MAYIEFSEDLSTRFEGKDAVVQRVLYRTKVLKGEVPYFQRGFSAGLFEFGGSKVLLGELRSLLKDFPCDVSVSGDRLLLGEIAINIDKLST